MEDRCIALPAGVRHAACWVAALAAVAMVGSVLWGGRRAVRPGGSGDLATVFAATRVWAAGGDPYAQRQVDRAYDAAGGTPGVRPTAEYTPLVYPPGTFAVMAPLAARPSRPLGRGVWASASGGLLLAMAAVLPGPADLDRAAAAFPVRRWTAAAVLTVPFLGSLALRLNRFRVGHRSPPVWEVLILPNPVWALCGLVVLMLCVLWRAATVETAT